MYIPAKSCLVIGELKREGLNRHVPIGTISRELRIKEPCEKSEDLFLKET